MGSPPPTRFYLVGQLTILPVGLFEPIADSVVLPVHVHLVPLLLVDVRSDLVLRSDMFTLVSNIK